MSVRIMWGLLLAVAVVGAYTYWTDPGRAVKVAGTNGIGALYNAPHAGEVTAVELIRSNSVIRVERPREGENWRLREPVAYPAQATAVEALLSSLERLIPRRWLSPEEVGGAEGLKAFGLDGNSATLNLETRSGPWIMRLGIPTPLGGQFYFQTAGQGGVFTADAHVLDLVPVSAAAWRDRALVDLRDGVVDRIELRRKTPLEAVRDPTTRQWRLVKPLASRANSDRINGLLATLQRTPVTAFVSDSPVVDLDQFGLQSPEAAVILSSGGRVLSELQFGRPSTNVAGQLYVRRMSHTNVVLVPAAISPLLQAPLAEFRDRRLVTFGSEVSRIEIRMGTNRTVAERSGTNWTMTIPERLPVAPTEAQALLNGLNSLRILDFPSGVVSDYGRYGLNPPMFSIGLVEGTNPPVEIQFSAHTGGDTVFAHRSDEPGVYSLAGPEVDMLPRTPNQLRSLSFSATNLVRVEIHQLGRQRTLERAADGRWTVATGAPGSLQEPALDEVVYRLGHLDSARWLVPNEALMTNLPSARELDHELVFSFAAGSPLSTLRWRVLADHGEAAVVLLHLDRDPSPVWLQVPGGLYDDVRRLFSVP